MLKVAELFSLEAFWCSSRVRSLADFFSFEVSHQKSESCWGGGGRAVGEKKLVQAASCCEKASLWNRKSCTFSMLLWKQLNFVTWHVNRAL